MGRLIPNYVPGPPAFICPRDQALVDAYQPGQPMTNTVNANSSYAYFGGMDAIADPFFMPTAGTSMVRLEDANPRQLPLSMDRKALFHDYTSNALWFDGHVTTAAVPQQQYEQYVSSGSFWFFYVRHFYNN